jgi:hypothetical protein
MSKEEVRELVLSIRTMAKMCDAVVTCACTLDDRMYKCTVSVTNKVLSISMQASGGTLGDSMLQALKDVKDLLQNVMDNEFCTGYCESLER